MSLKSDITAMFVQFWRFANTGGLLIQIDSLSKHRPSVRHCQCHNYNKRTVGWVWQQPHKLLLVLWNFNNLLVNQQFASVYYETELIVVKAENNLKPLHVCNIMLGLHYRAENCDKNSVRFYAMFLSTLSSPLIWNSLMFAYSAALSMFSECVMTRQLLGHICHKNVNICRIPVMWP